MKEALTLELLTKLSDLSLVQAYGEVRETYDEQCRQYRMDTDGMYSKEDQGYLESLLRDCDPVVKELAKRGIHACTHCSFWEYIPKGPRCKRCAEAWQKRAEQF